MAKHVGVEHKICMLSPVSSHWALSAQPSTATTSCAYTSQAWREGFLSRHT